MRAHPRHLVAFFLLAAIACGARAFIDIDSDRDTPFWRLKTFAFMKGTPALDPANDSRIRTAVRRELGARGLTEVEEDPDILVVTHATVGGPRRFEEEAFAYGGYPQNGWAVPDPGGQGTLLIDILDGESKRRIWRGLAVDNMPTSKNKILKKIDKLIRKLFKHYPG